MKFLYFVPFLILIFFTSCKKDDYKNILHDPLLYSRTVHELNGVVMGNNFTPVVASRNYAYASIAGYEAIAAGYPEKYESLAGQLNGLTKVAQPIKKEYIDFEYASLLAFCKVGEAVTFPEGSLKLYTDSLHELAKAHGMSNEMVDSTENYAKALAKSIIVWSKTDNYLKTRSAPKFAINDSVGRWIPTPPAYSEAVEPHWGEIRPMVINNLINYKVAAPPTFNVKDTASAYYKDLIYSKNAIDHLNPEQTHMANFWDDNPGKLNVNGHVMFITKKFSPPGHWMSVVGIGAEKTKSDFGTTVCAYAKTSIALFDAFIECWSSKYTYKTARPETIINKYIDPNWRPLLQTPPFPEYTCGHTTISAAAAEVLTSVLGENVAYTDTSELEFGIKSRSFKSFKDAAKENIWARFYGGVHFHNSCIVSNKMGTIIGDSIVKKLKMKKN